MKSLLTIIADSPGGIDARPRIGWRNLFTDAALLSLTTPTSGGASLPGDALDGRTATRWTQASGTSGAWTVTFATPQAASYLWIYGHACAGGTITVKRDVGGTPTVVWTGTCPTGFLYAAWSTLTSTSWTVEFSSLTGVPSFALISIGQDTQLEYAMRAGFVPPRMAQVGVVDGTVSVVGGVLGRSVTRKTMPFMLPVDLMTDTWCRAEWLAFTQFAETRPFGFSWRPDLYPEDAVLAYIEKPDRDITAASYLDRGLLKAKLKCMGYADP